jgi:hypothetical protein
MIFRKVERNVATGANNPHARNAIIAWLNQIDIIILLSYHCQSDFFVVIVHVVEMMMMMVSVIVMIVDIIIF